jgi:hypothetical protein
MRGSKFFLEGSQASPARLSVKGSIKSGRQSCTGAGLHRVLRFPLPILIPPNEIRL